MFRLVESRRLVGRGYCLLALLANISIAVEAPIVSNAPTLSKEFWEYMSDYGDETDNYLDPLEYELLVTMKNDESVNIDQASQSQQGPQENLDRPILRHADMRVEKRSSVKASSSEMRGAAL
jgi:hypothetical protein